MNKIIRILVIVVPWLMAAGLPIWMFSGADADPGIFSPVRLLGFEFLLIPLAPLMLLRCMMANPGCSVALKLLLFAVGAICPLVVALLFARFWSRRWFWLVWCGYLLLLAFDVILAAGILKEFV